MGGLSVLGIAADSVNSSGRCLLDETEKEKSCHAA